MKNVKKGGSVESGTQEATVKRGKSTEAEDGVVCTEVQKRDRSHEDSYDRGIRVLGLQRKKQTSL